LCLALSIAVVGGFVTACAGPKAPAMQAQVQQYREDEVAGRLQLGLTNLTSSPVQVRSVQLQWLGLVTQPPTVVNYTFTPGVRADQAVPLGTAKCTRPTPSFTSAKVVVVFAATGQREEVPVIESADVLRRVYATTCQAQYLATQLDAAFGKTWTPVSVAGGPALQGVLRLARKGFKGQISIVDLRGTVVLRLLPTHPTDPMAVMPSTAAVVSLPVYMQPARCDLHALGEVKKPFAFVVGVRLGNSVRMPVHLTPDAATKARLWRLIKTGCGVP
jgi:hypothetical protein